MYSEILLPTDGSEASKSAVKHAEQLAEKFDARIHLLYVVDVTAVPGELAAQARMEQMKEIGEDTLDSIEDELSTNKIEANVKVGLPHQEINAYVEENEIDLVTMGSHGRSGLDRILLGSVTEKVLRTCEAPVLTARPDHSES